MIITLRQKVMVILFFENNKNIRELSSVFDDQDDKVDNNKARNLNSGTINRNPTIDDELSNRNDFDDELDKNTTLSFNQTLENSLTASFRNNVSNFKKYNRKRILGTTIKGYPNSGGYWSQQWI